MLYLDIEISYTGEDGTVNIKGKGVTETGDPWTMSGTMASNGPVLENFPIEFDRTLPNKDCVKYLGSFDVQQSMLSGVYEVDTDLSRGSFLFKRMSTPYIMCHRPLTEKLGAKALWSFACRAVLDNVRRRSFRPLFLYERVMMVKECIELTHKGIIRGLNADELNAICRLRMAFTPSEYRAVTSMCRWFIRVGDLQAYVPRTFTLRNN